MYQNFIGIDISKKDFVVAVSGKQESKIYMNDETGFCSFFEAHEEALKKGLVVLETTGGYELALIYYLQARQCAVHRADARKVKYFIRSYGRLAKSDRIDAQGLARYGEERHAGLDLYQANLNQRLFRLVQRRIELKGLVVQEKNRRQSPGLHELRSSFDAIIAAIEQELTVINNELAALCKADRHLARKSKQLRTIPGIGEVIAIELLALLPELGSLSGKKIASLAGLAPHPNESGSKRGYRATRGGRQGIKPILFMAALTAMRSQTSLGSFYERLVGSGKKKMVALTALMRKIVVIANAKLKDFMRAEGSESLVHDK